MGETREEPQGREVVWRREKTKLVFNRGFGDNVMSSCFFVCKKKVLKSVPKNGTEKKWLTWTASNSSSISLSQGETSKEKEEIEEGMGEPEGPWPIVCDLMVS